MTLITYGYYYIGLNIGNNRFFLNYLPRENKLVFQKDNPFVWKYQNGKLFIESMHHNLFFVASRGDGKHLGLVGDVNQMRSYGKNNALSCNMYDDGRITLDNMYLGFRLMDNSIDATLENSPTAFTILFIKPALGELIL